MIESLLFTMLLMPFPVGRAQLIDVNEDGWLDLVIENRTYLHQSDGSYQEQLLYSKASFLVWGDLNNDGHLDAIAIQRQGQHQLCLYQQPPQPLTGQSHNTLAAILSDLDRDGNLDFAIANSYIDEGKSLDAEPMRVFRGPDFEDVSQQWGLDTPGPPGAANGARPLFGLTATDLDNDGYPEILGAAYGRQWNTLWKRDTTARYSECAAKYALDGDALRHGKYPAGSKRVDELPYRSNGNTFCLAPADFDDDGDWDLFSADITHSWAGDSSDLSALLVNRLETFQAPYFERQLDDSAVDPETGFRARPTRGLHRNHAPQTPQKWNQGDLQAHWADLDQDGRLDLIVCESDYPNNHLRIFLQGDQHLFHEAQQELGVNFNNCPGVAMGDVDRDGDLDMVTTGTRTRWPEARPKPEMALWINPSKRKGLSIKLIGHSANRSAIGARLLLTTSQGNQNRAIDGPYGHWGQQAQPGEVHFGLGASVPRSLRVVWPDPEHSQTTYANLPDCGWVIIDQERGVIHSSPTFDPAAWSH
ncbi:CRTAC1 family protein [bacterium]|nr:CRTAC1 family protein [bacterium]